MRRQHSHGSWLPTSPTMFPGELAWPRPRPRRNSLAGWMRPTCGSDVAWATEHSAPDLFDGPPPALSETRCSTSDAVKEKSTLQQHRPARPNVAAAAQNLHDAAKAGDEDTVARLLDEGADVDGRDARGITPLGVAVGPPRPAPPSPVPPCPAPPCPALPSWRISRLLQRVTHPGVWVWYSSCACCTTWRCADAS